LKAQIIDQQAHGSGIGRKVGRTRIELGAEGWHGAFLNFHNAENTLRLYA